VAAGAAAGEEPRKRGYGLRTLIESSVYMYTVTALSSLFFVVTGVQFWVTAYLTKVLGADKKAVVLAFAIVSITAPLLGVYTGGVVIDRLGGYKGAAGTITTLKCCCLFSLIAASSAASTCFVTPGPAAFWVVIVLLCLTLIFGGAIIPSATGVLINAVPAEARQVASAGSMLFFNLFGYALSPLFSAMVMQLVQGSPEYKLTIGFRIVMCWGVIGVIAFVGAKRAAVRQHKQTLSPLHKLDAQTETSIDAIADASEERA